MNRQRLNRPIILFLAITALFAACENARVVPSATPEPVVPTPFVPSLTPTAPAPTATPTRPSAMPTAATTSAAPPPPTPTAMSVGESPLSATGPWWAFFVGEGMWAESLWAVNADGSGLTQLTEGRIIVPRDLEAAVSPVGGHLAFITATDASLRGLTLNLLKLPEGEIGTLTPLSSPGTEPEAGADPALRPPEPLIAISQEVSLAWSPKGDRLAFMAAFEGPSSDLYVYSVVDDSLTRLTDGPSEAIRPSWSPDGVTILHLGVETLGTGAGYRMAGVWAARADGAGVTSLYDPGDSSDERVVGWLAEDTFAVYTWSVGQGGPMNLRAVNVETGVVHVLWAGSFNDVALDPGSGALLLALGPEADEPAGLYLISAGDAAPWRVVEDVASGLTWSAEAVLFFALTEHGVLAVSPRGDTIDLAVPGRRSGFPSVAPATRELAWTGSGLWIGSLTSSIDDPPRQIHREMATKAGWSPDGRHVLFFADGGLYVAHASAFDPVLVAEGVRANAAVWVWP